MVTNASVMHRVVFLLDNQTHGRLQATCKPPMTVNRLCKKLICLTVNGGPFMDELMLGQEKA